MNAHLLGKAIENAEKRAPTVLDCVDAFHVPGEDHLVDSINPATGRSWINGETLEQIRQRYPNAEVVNIEAFCKAKAERQDVPVEWLETTKERYWEMLEVLPPADHYRDGFLVGEPWDHHAGNGQPRFQAYLEKAGNRYLVSSRPMTRKEFRALWA